MDIIFVLNLNGFPLSHSTVMPSLSRAFLFTSFGSLNGATALENKQNSILAYLCEFYTIIFFIFSVSIILLTNYDDERLSSFICLSTFYSSTNVCCRGIPFYLKLKIGNCNKFDPSPFERRNMEMIARQNIFSTILYNFLLAFLAIMIICIMIKIFSKGVEPLVSGPFGLLEAVRRELPKGF